MSVSEKEQLMNELFESSELAELRRSSLELGLASLRRRRNRARALRGILIAAVPIALLVVILAQPAAPPRAVVAPPTAATGTKSIKFITDEQLLALFPDRSVALIGKPGQQQLVFLDQPSARR